MTATTFNPLEIAHDLEAAGFERRQAKAIDHGDERAATKADLRRRSGRFDVLQNRTVSYLADGGVVS